MIEEWQLAKTRLARGRRRAETLRSELLRQLRTTRVSANVSQRTLARDLGWSASRYRRFESGRSGDVSLLDLTVAASALGLDLGAGLHPMGAAVLDRGHQALLRRLRAILSSAIRVTAETPLMLTGSRSWDLLFRAGRQLMGVEAETRIRDVQVFVRRIRLRERDGGADMILIVLSDSHHNRAIADELREALGDGFATSPRSILSALRDGRPLPGSGVILI